MAKVDKIYQLLLERLPSTYPQATLVIHKTLTSLRKSYFKGETPDIDDPFAFCNSSDMSIHASKSFYKIDTNDIVFYLLHEVGHLYAYKKYGDKDIRWEDYKSAERYANRFAYRWLKKLIREKWFAKIKNGGSSKK